MSYLGVMIDMTDRRQLHGEQEKRKHDVECGGACRV